MEHAQRVNQLKFNSNMKNVLILILMEHAQRGHNSRNTNNCRCLNPYFNGTCSKSLTAFLTRYAGEPAS